MKNKTHQLTLSAILCAIAVALSFIEYSLLPPLPAGVKMGLSNLCVLVAIEFLGVKSGFAIAFTKSAFVFLTRGAIAFAMSVSGGLLACLAACFLLRLTSASCILTSSICGIIHNIGQLITASIITRSIYTLWYFPLLTLSGAFSGVFTGFLFFLVCTRLSCFLKNRR